MAVRSTSSSAPTSGASAGQPSLVPQGNHLGKPPIPLTRVFTLVGARNRAHLHLVSPSISKNHSAIISSEDGSVYVRDLCSRTHTIVNGKAVKEAALAHADTLTVGSFSFKVANRVSRRARAAAEAPAAALEVDGAEFPIPFEQQTLLIGRRPTCDIPLVEESVSTIHAILFTAGAKRYIRDLGSRTGTFVNGSPIHQHELNFGDEIRVGDTSMRYESHHGAGEHLDELEHLVGTAALDEAPPMGHPLPEYDPTPTEVAKPQAVQTHSAHASDDLIPVESHDDLIPLAEEDAIPVAHGDVPAPIAKSTHDEPIEVEVEAIDEIAIPVEETPEPEVAPIEAEVELPHVEEPELASAAAVGLPDIEELQPLEIAEVPAAPVMAEVVAPRAPIIPAAAPVIPVIEDEHPDLDFADEVTEEEVSAEADAPVAVPASRVEVAVDVEPSLLEEEAADEAAAVAETPAPLRPEDTAFNFPRHETEEAATESVDLDFVPEAEHPADLGGLDFSDRTEPAPRHSSAHTPNELPELDLSGLTLDPPADESSATDLGLDFADDIAATSAAAPLLNLGVTPPAVPSMPVPPFGNFDLSEAPAARDRAEKRPVARKEKPKKEKKTWWSRKRKAQEEEAPLGAPKAETSEPIPEEPLDAQIERALSGSFGSGISEEAALDAIEPLKPEPAAELSNDPFDLDTAAAAEPTAHDSFAGLDFSAVATGSGLDFDGEIDAVEPPAKAEYVLPPLAPVAETAAPIAAAETIEEELEVIESTEPTPESALDIGDELSIEPLSSEPASPTASATGGLSDFGQFTEAASLSDTAFGRAVFDFSGSSLDPIIEATPAMELAAESTEPVAEEEIPVLEAAVEPEAEAEVAAVEAIAEPAAEDESLLIAEAPALAVETDTDLSFDQLLDEELGLESPAAPAAPVSLEARQFAPVDDDEEPAEAAPEAKVFDLQGWTPPAAAAAPVIEVPSEPEAPATAEIFEGLPFAPDEVEDAATAEISAEEAAELPFAPAESAKIDAESDELLPSIAAKAEVVSEATSGTTAVDLEPESVEEIDEFESLSEIGTGLAESESEDEEPEAAAVLPAVVPSDIATPVIPESPSHPMVSDLTSPTEDQVVAIAADPADAGHLGAAEAIDFDLDLEEVPALADATIDDLAPAEPTEETLEEAFENAIGRDEEVESESLPELSLAAVAPVEESILSNEITDSGLDFEEEPELESLEAFEPPTEEAPPELEPVADASIPEPAKSDDEIGGSLPSDPFFGLGRDTGSFLGGLPLALPQAAPTPPPSAGFTVQPRGKQQLPARRPAGLPAFGSVPIGQVRRPGAPALPGPETPAAEEVVPIDFDEPAPPTRASNLTPPPPTRSAPPRAQSPAGHGGMFGLGLGDVANGTVEIPPLAAHSHPVAGQLTTAFDSLAFESDGQTDVFSQLAPTNDPVFGNAGRKSAADLDAEVDEALQNDEEHDDDMDGGGDGAPLDELPPGDYSGNGDHDAAIDPPPAALPGRADSKREKDRRPPGYTPPPSDPSRQPAAAPAAQPPKKRRWGVRFLLPLMLLCGAGAAAAVYFLQPVVLPRGGTVTGFLEFDRLKNLPPSERAAFTKEQAEMIRNAGVLSSAADLLRSRPKYEKMPPGFLGGSEPADVRAVDVIATNVKIPEDADKLELYLDHSTDPKGDQIRMRWLLEELFLRNAGLRDKSGSNKGNLEAITAERDEKTRKIAILKARIEQIRLKADSDLGTESIDDLAAQEQQLYEASVEATKKVHDIQADLDAAAGTDGTAPAVDGSTGTTLLGDDPQLAQMNKQLQMLSQKLAADRDARTAATTNATAAVNDALKKFQAEVDSAQKAVSGGDGKLAAYLESAQRMQQSFSDMHDSLARQMAGSLAMLNDLKKRLDEKSKAKLNDAWSNDSELKQLQETLSIKEHHRNAAAGSALAADVKKLDSEISQLTARIQARRDLLGTGFAYDAEVKDLQKIIDESVARVESQRAANEQQMAEQLANLKKDAPSVEKLPAEQQKLAEALEQRTAELNAAREQYAKAASVSTTSVSGSENGVAEKQLTQVQAKIDARKRELADAAAQSLTQKQKQDRLALLERRKAELTDAKATETRALSAYIKNKLAGAAKANEIKEIETARGELQSANDASDKLAKDQKALNDQLAQATEANNRSIAPVPVRDSNVTVSLDEDTRPLSASIAFVAVVVLFSLMMWFVSHTPHDASDSIPIAAAAFLQAESTGVIIEPTSEEVLPDYEPDPVPALPAPRRGKAGRKVDASQGDEHPLPV